MKGHLTKNLEFCQFQVISIFGIWSMLPSMQVRLRFPILFFYFLISFLHIPYPACRHITSFFLSPYPFSELFYTALRWCFFYNNFIFFHIYRIFGHPTGRSHFACRICYVYQIIFPSVFLLVFFALVPL